MYIAPMTEVLITPSLSSLLGTNASSDVLTYLNNQYGSQGGVIFGQPGDPLADSFNNLMNVVTQQLVQTDQIVQDTVTAVEQPYMIRAITSEEQLYHTPVSMQLPILMYAPVRKLFEEDRIYGYGYDKTCLPDEDVFGRLIDNGSVVFNPDHYEDKKIPEYITEEWKTDDPILSEEELEDIEKTRAFVMRYLQEQMKEGGDMRDPTDPSNRISQPRRKRKT